MKHQTNINNFPRDGQHQPVTRAYLDELFQSRSVPNAKLEYTIGGMRETLVHSSLEADRQSQLVRGERILKTASQELQNNYAFKSLEGHAKGDFKTAAKKEHPSINRVAANENQAKKSSIRGEFKEQGKLLLQEALALEAERSKGHERER